MKKISILALAAVTLLASCKKNKDAESCEVSVAGLAGNYKISKVEVVSSIITTDVTATFLQSCERDDIYQLKADKTLVYQDGGVSCGGSATRNGTWDVVNGKLTINASAGGDVSGGSVTNNCSSFVTEETGSVRTTFVKQ
jgi:hypothetical protein